VFDFRPEWEIIGNLRMMMDLACSLQSQGHAVRIISSSMDTCTSAEVEGIGLSLIRGSWSEQVRLLRSWISEIKEFAPDVIHGHGVSTSWWISVLSLLTGISSVHTYNGTTELPLMPRPALPSAARYLAALGLTGIICSNKYVFDSLPSYAKSKARVIRYGLQGRLLRIDARTSGDSCSVVFWSEARLRRGFDILLLAMQRILRSRPGITFSLYVKPDWESAAYRDSRLRFIEALGKRVKLHVYPYSFDLFEEIARGDIVALPFLQNPMEPPLTLIESMALGKAVIATDIGGNSEIVDDGCNGILVQPGSVESLVKAVLGLSQDMDKVYRLGQRARYSIQRIYDTKIMLNEVLQIYEGVSSSA